MTTKELLLSQPATWDERRRRAAEICRTNNVSADAVYDAAGLLQRQFGGRYTELYGLLRPMNLQSWQTTRSDERERAFKVAGMLLSLLPDEE